MSLNLNKIVLAGRLTATPELKQTQSGVSVASCRLAVNRRAKSGEEPVTDFFNFTAWRGVAEFLCNYFTKGSAICICGSLQVRTWQDRDGANRSTVEIVADEINFVESRANSEASVTPQAPSEEARAVYNTPMNAAPKFEEIKLDGDLPF